MTMSFLLSFAFFFGAAAMLSSRNILVGASHLRFGSMKTQLQRGRRDTTHKLTLKIVNLTYKQPFSSFFIMVHNSQPPPLFEFGENATDALAFLAETGSPSQLIELFNGTTGVLSVSSLPGPLGGGGTTFVDIEYNRWFRFMTIASMLISTNDAFVAVNGLRLSRGRSLFLDALDAGSEENTELCINVPGPACVDIDTSNERATEDAEGFVHVHRGLDGFGDISSAVYDWRNPVAKISLM